MIYFISQSRKKFELSGNYAEFLSNAQVTHNLTHLPHPLKAQQNPYCLARPGADLLNTPETQLLCAHTLEGTGLSIPSAGQEPPLHFLLQVPQQPLCTRTQPGFVCVCVCI